MNNRLPSVVMSGLLACAVTGCSVKEERGECPCSILLDLRSIGTDTCDSLRITVSADGFFYEDTVHEDRYVEEYVIEAPRCELNLNIYGGDWPVYLQETAEFVIPPGDDCCMVWKHSALLDANAESLTEKVMLHKSCCQMTVKFLFNGDSSAGNMAGAARLPFSVQLSGNVDGYAADGNPRPGMFLYSPHLEEDGTFVAGLPRQEDSSLKLLVSEGELVLREFAIGEYIAESGYDWTLPDLEDISIIIDYAATNVTFRIGGWEKTCRFDIVL